MWKIYLAIGDNALPMALCELLYISKFETIMKAYIDGTMLFRHTPTEFFTDTLMLLAYMQHIHIMATTTTGSAMFLVLYPKKINPPKLLDLFIIDTLP
jgi:hypothetical protein